MVKIDQFPHRILGLGVNFPFIFDFQFNLGTPPRKDGDVLALEKEDGLHERQFPTEALGLSLEQPDAHEVLGHVDNEFFLRPNLLDSRVAVSLLRRVNNFVHFLFE